MRRFLSVLLLIALGIVVAVRSGGWLVLDKPTPSDVIVVLEGDVNNQRYWKGLEMLGAGYGRVLLVDVAEDQDMYGHTPADLAREYIEKTAHPSSGRVSVCPIRGDSTVEETRYAANCLRPLQPRKVLLVTSDFHSRRAFSIFEKILPQYSWSSAIAFDHAIYGIRWWQHREWSKTYLMEYEKLAWWTFVERWRV